MKTKTKVRIATIEESLHWLNGSVPKHDRDAMELPDGHADACRLLINCATGEPALMSDGTSLAYCAPWLLTDIMG